MLGKWDERGIYEIGLQNEIYTIVEKYGFDENLWNALTELVATCNRSFHPNKNLKEVLGFLQLNIRNVPLVQTSSKYDWNYVSAVNKLEEQLEREHARLSVDNTSADDDLADTFIG